MAIIIICEALAYDAYYSGGEFTNAFSVCVGSYDVIFCDVITNERQCEMDLSNLLW